MTTSLVLFAITGGVMCCALGVFLGRLITLKGFTWTLKDAIGVGLISAFIAVLFLLFWKEIPTKNEQLIVYMLGQLSGFVAGVVSSHYVHKAGETRLEEKRQDIALAQAEAQRASAEAMRAGPGGKAAEEAAADASRATADAADRKAEQFERRTSTGDPPADDERTR